MPFSSILSSQFVGKNVKRRSNDSFRLGAGEAKLMRN